MYKRQVGDVEVKRRLAVVLNEFLAPIRQRRAEFAKYSDIGDIVRKGTEKSQEQCKPVVESVREKMHLVYPKRS